MPDSSVPGVRLSDQKRRLLEEAAEDARTSSSDFVRRQALEMAEEALMDRSTSRLAGASVEMTAMKGRLSQQNPLNDDIRGFYRHLRFLDLEHDPRRSMVVRLKDMIASGVEPLTMHVPPEQN